MDLIEDRIVFEGSLEHRVAAVAVHNVAGVDICDVTEELRTLGGRLGSLPSYELPVMSVLPQASDLVINCLRYYSNEMSRFKRLSYYRSCARGMLSDIQVLPNQGD